MGANIKGLIPFLTPFPFPTKPRPIGGLVCHIREAGIT